MGPATMRPSVLVVENHRDLCTEIVAALQREHYPCESARTGAAAMLKLREHNYEYILIDDDEATGAGPLLARLTAEADAQTKVIVMTDIDPQGDLPYLRKPFDNNALMARLRSR